MGIRFTLAFAVLCLCAPDSALAQRREQREMMMRYQTLPVVNLKGKVVQVGAGLIQVEDENGNPNVVQVDPMRTRVVVSGTAKPSVLRPGMLVQFTTELDNRQLNAKEPVSDLQIFSAGAGYALGVTSDDPEGKGGPYRVAGQVKTFKEGRLAVQAEKRQVRAVVADDATIKFEGADYSLARAGDEIDVQGRLFGQGQVFGETVKVTLAQPIEGEVASPRSRRRGKKPPEAAPMEPAPAPGVAADPAP